MRQDRVGIITVTYNSAVVLADFITSLERQTHTDWQLWAVDNHSTDTTLEQLAQWGDARLTVVANPENRGVAHGNNQGIEAALAAGCTHILLLNNDVWFGDDLIAGLLHGLHEHGCDLTTPLMYYAEPSNRIWCAGGGFRERLALLPMHFGKDEEDQGQCGEARSIDYAPTCCTLMRRAVFDRIGMMDERFFVYSDDVDFMVRAMRAGLRTVYLPQVKLWHKVSSLTGQESPFSQRYLTRNRAFLIRKHLPWRTLAGFTVLYRVYYVARFLLRKDSWTVLLRKQKAWSEGLRVS